MNLMKYKVWYLVFSAVLLVPGIVSLFIHGLDLSIDFTGGSVFKYKFADKVDVTELKQIFENHQITVEGINVEEENVAVIRTKPVEAENSGKLKSDILEKFKDTTLLSFETVGPAVGAETTANAFKSLFWASVAILLYIAFAFRNIPKPYSSFRFGVSAIVAMLHDAFMVLGLFSILGYFFKIEVDSLFITAVLTIIGFSVHDTIVVFDRIRENLRKLPHDMGFEGIVNYSVVETLSRSLATSLTVIFTLFSLYMLGGANIKTFTLALLVGIVSGTYSSIFNAAPVLVLWEAYIQKRRK
jgi:preprotein translocase subunit SecF